jgi:hypothetical protein
MPVLIRTNRFILKSSTNYQNNITGNKEIKGKKNNHTATADIIRKVIKQEVKTFIHGNNLTCTIHCTTEQLQNCIP